MTNINKMPEPDNVRTPERRFTKDEKANEKLPKEAK
jgi:hypothetical protein